MTSASEPSSPRAAAGPRRGTHPRWLPGRRAQPRRRRGRAEPAARDIDRRRHLRLERGRGHALLARRDAVPAAVDASETTYRWTTALNGFAAELTPEQVTALETNTEVESVEANTVLPMAGRVTSTGALASRTVPARGRAGSGVVIGFVDSGLAPDSPLFADVPGLGARTSTYAGECTTGADWTADSCNRKVVGSGWWVAGFGEERIRSSESLSPLDAIGHGTRVASVAAGNSDVSVRVNGRTMGNFGGVAPRARVAPYKACWAAPDPADDGCATADLVSAIDRATADRVDVLNVAVAGPTSIDTVERALLGAAEADIVVVGAAGNAGRTAFAGHTSPWVTTVGATRGSILRGRVSVVRGPSPAGASRSRRALGPVRLVLGSDVAASGARRRDARECVPGSLDAHKVADRAVLCVRGAIGRADKSEAVALADGVAMVLVNDRPGGVIDDFHSVPTVQLTQRDGRRLMRWARTHRRTVVRLSGVAPQRSAARAAGWSASGDSRSALLKPDIVAPGEGVLGATPGSWALFSGTSAATARVSGPGRAAPRRARLVGPGGPVRAHHHGTAGGRSPHTHAGRRPGELAAQGRARPRRRDLELSPRPRRPVVGRPEFLVHRDARRGYGDASTDQPRLACGVLLGPRDRLPAAPRPDDAGGAAARPGRDRHRAHHHHRPRRAHPAR
ncbi:S8 family serine peptidase [Nocardioides sp. B-3]|nr:S8 family serine peptidase [Nocardioides sp. B-3]UUZ57815.1 S8 family serine peptidase [Nocardioides sp. B-3]